MLILIHHEICSNVQHFLNLSVKEAPWLPILEVANIKLLEASFFGLIVWLNPIRCNHVIINVHKSLLYLASASLNLLLMEFLKSCSASIAYGYPD
jgi:hypothetical protein